MHRAGRRFFNRLPANVERAKVRFPTFNYLDPDGQRSLRTGRTEDREAPVWSTSVVGDIRIPRFVVPATLTDARTNRELREALAYDHEKVSDTKAEMLARMAGVCARLYGKHEKKLRKLSQGRYAGHGACSGGAVLKGTDGLPPPPPSRRLKPGMTQGFFALT